jgi:aminoglycoside phosphotransferase (APT) family kinase protein
VADIEVDFTILETRLAAAGFADVCRLSGGASSLSYAATQVTDGRRPVVVKMAPPGLPPVRNRDVLRQAAMLRLLGPTVVPVPEVLWEDAGDPPDVPPMFVMSFVEGTSCEPLFDTDGTDDPVVVGERMGNAARTLAALHAISPGELGLDDEPVTTPGDEVKRWVHALQTVDPSLVPGWDGIAESLATSEPPSVRPAVVHGDFRLGNLLATGSSVTAVIDWEIWSVGDPRVDLGWFLANADPETYRRSTPYVGRLPSPDDLASVYADALGQPVPSLNWVRALACFKSAATWSLIVKHARRRPTPDPTAEEIAATLPSLLGRAGALLGAG